MTMCVICAGSEAVPCSARAECACMTALWGRTVPYLQPFPALAQRLFCMIQPRFVELATYWCSCEPEVGLVAICEGAQPSVGVC